MYSFYAMITVMDQPGYPAHPIAPGGPPPGIWGGSNEGFPTHPIAPGGRPGQPPSIWPGGRPVHPIVIPPEKPGDPPLVIWGGGNEPFPTPPIQLPGVGGSPPPGGGPVQIIEWKTAWTPQTGWIVVGVPQMPHPVPG